jgi:hypothetical protein
MPRPALRRYGPFWSCLRIACDVGSFSEVVLGFSFRPDTPDRVLAAFSALAVPSPPDVHGKEALVLPDPLQVQDDEDEWEPTNELQDPADDPQPFAA